MSCDLSVEIAGLRFKNPVLTASGTFGYGIEFAQWFDLGRLGGICTKGLSLEPLEGNPPPRIVETHGGMLNSIGLQNIGVRAFVAEKLPLLRQFQTHIIANVFGSCFEEYLEVIRILDDAEGIAAYELNISCPNVKAGGMEFGNDPDEAARLTEACKRIARRPIIVKLSPNAGDIVRVACAVESAGADAISAINTILGLSVDIYTRRPRLAMGMGGLSGPAIKPIAVRMVYQIVRAVRIPVIGIGGIATPEDALEFLIAGATAVQIGTANYYDPLVSIKVIEGLQQFCQQQRITAIRSLIGSLRMDERLA
ncbi:MAG: dihydroorotate dehydrogenase [Blastocatellia bacterium]|nr:dihydroorotate dehydrogenase [Blastocatellia bacterium]MCS7157599.1 dihydroorotate dehydrogenase [Blastocatellia bacterium]MCX7751864.1 dihydroorotate dehydrogenase [Blastocatellia bacterium]MDW8166970.1 dihydroorotate dehydrogenase [Acidobacteriota bacterium]MDW8257074.1 dihydroorotate dehydrogenase [Acidobacteriota bacterium]